MTIQPRAILRRLAGAEAKAVEIALKTTDGMHAKAQNALLRAHWLVNRLFSAYDRWLP